ncbi:MAG: hypothetical protein FJ388_24275, partial [Verrucomicrobia bacterium]|nr:hypothetical protein [Verrucomicrobiota bacterium]
MKIQFRFRGFNGLGGLRSFLEEQLEEMHSDLPITSAEVVLENQLEATPACRIRVHLALPGPDIRVSARDHTPLAAWLKVSDDLRREIKRRRAKQIVRLKSKLQLRGSKSRRSGA